jgi:hypothetical protein
MSDKISDHYMPIALPHFEVDFGLNAGFTDGRNLKSTMLDLPLIP